VDEVALVPEVGIAPSRLFEHPELPHEAYLETRLLSHLADQGVFDRLTGLDASAGHDSRVVGLVEGVDDEQLVGTGCRMLARDVGDDSRPDDQLD